MKKVLQAIYRFTDFGSYLQSPILLLIRLYWGLGFFIAGFGKLLDISKFNSFLESLNVPFADGNAYFVAGLETVGGLLLAAGLFSRLISIPLLINMIVAYLLAHYETVQHIFVNPQGFFNATPFLFLLTSLLVLAFGPGKFSLDYLLGGGKMSQ